MAGQTSVPPDLKSPGTAPTSELRAAYDELRQYLTLRSTDELDGTTRIKEGTQTADTQRSKSSAISTLLSPDGAFFTVDLFNRDLITQIGLTPASLTGTGDINIYGTKDFKVNDTITYSENLSLREKVGLVPSKTTVIDKETTSSIVEAIADIDKRIKEEEDVIKQLQKQKDEVFLNPIEGGTPGTYEVSGVQLSNTGQGNIGLTIALEEQKIQVEIDAKKKVIDELNKEKASEQARLDLRRNSDQKTDVIFTGINSKETIPDAPNTPQVSLYRHVNRYLDPSSTASDYCNVFFNAIDSINMSLCVPFFRLNIIDRFSKKKGRYSKLSLAAFLKQTQDYDNDMIFYNSEPILFGAPTQIAKKLKSGKVVGLETFYAPQTLLPDPTEVLSNPRRLDTSVPLLSLNSFSVAIESTGIALMSKKTADLSITLHDRSRMSDISPLVSVGNFSSLYFEIEWGWIHPHAAPEFNNPVARYLNALRFREIFAPISYNMSMQDGGAMTINLRLIGGASTDAVNGSILNGGFISRSLASDLLNRLIKADIEETEGREKATADIKPVSSILIDKSRTANLVDRKFVDKIWEYSKNDNSSDATRKSLIKELISILNDTRYFKNDEVFEKLKKILTDVNITGFESAYDRLKLNEFGTVKEEYTTVAAYLTLFVGMPLAATGLYDEVQIHTFKFNDAAGNLKGAQICDTPIRLLDVVKRPDMAGSLSENSSINNALLLLGNYLNNPKQPQYGIAEQTTYDKIKVEATKPAEDPTRSVDDKSRRPPEDDLKIDSDFTTPNIRYIVRSIPAKVFPDSSKSLADYQVDSSRLIAQVIVYDSNASPNFDRIIKAYEYGKVKGTNPKNEPIPTAGITADEAKATFKRLAPSITYGAVNSVMRSVSVSTDLNPVIAQQQILEIGKDLFLGNVKADESSDVNEIRLFPGAVSVSMLGMPIIERGQEIYLDLGTGTTLDSLYYVTSVKHDLKPGEFTTSLSLIYKGQGSVTSLTSMIENYNKTFEKPKQAETKKSETPTSTPTSAPAAESLPKSSGGDVGIIDPVTGERMFGT